MHVPNPDGHRPTASAATENITTGGHGHTASPVPGTTGSYRRMASVVAGTTATGGHRPAASAATGPAASAATGPVAAGGRRPTASPVSGDTTTHRSTASPVTGTTATGGHRPTASAATGLVSSGGRPTASPVPGNTTTGGMCPRVRWRSVNPALPPPDSLTCLAHGPDCCATSAVADVRRAA
jgi:hypothetical protein